MYKFVQTFTIMKYDVIACGESVLRYANTGNKTVGVNDCYRFYPVDYLVCVDKPSVFSVARLKIIKESTPKKFFTSLNDWENMIPAYEKINLASGSGRVVELNNPNRVCHSICSPFVACVMAYKLGAKEINLYGADFNTHHALSEDTKKKRVLKDFKALNEALLENGCILKVTKESLLSTIIESF